MYIEFPNAEDVRPSASREDEVVVRILTTVRLYWGLSLSEPGRFIGAGVEPIPTPRPGISARCNLDVF